MDVLSYLALSVAGLFLACLLSYYRRWKFQKGYNLPPGPHCWPIIGFLPYPSINSHLTLGRLARKYGGIFGLYVGSKYVVILDDLEAVKECFSKDTFLDRPPNYLLISPDQPSIINMSGHGWKQQRRFQMNSFRLLGSQTKEFHRFVVSYAMDAINELKKKVGQNVNTCHAVEHALNNVTFRLLYGRSFEINHPLIRTLTDYNEAVVNIFGTQALTVFLPWIYSFFEMLPYMKQAKKSVETMDKIIKSEIRNHQNSILEDEPRDYIDHYLLEMRKPNCHTSYSMQNLIGNMKILLEASSETSNISLSWFLLCMAKFQEAQEGLYKEIRDVIGSEKEPEYEDRHKMPFTMAVILETTRWKNLIHLNVCRQCSEDSKICGYDIPKGTIIIQNMTSHFHNATYWPRPEQFDPKRFLSSDGKTVVIPEQYIPFSLGSRMCLGEKLAKTVLFLFAVILVQKFKILPSKEGVNLDAKPIFNNNPVHPYVTLELRQ